MAMNHGQQQWQVRSYSRRNPFHVGCRIMELKGMKTL
jgi:hypothetical protein